MLRHWRGRLGLSAPRVSVRPHVPWYMRLLGAIFAVIVVIALSITAYTIGRNHSGYGKSAKGQEFADLRTEVDELRAESERLRAISNGSEASVQIERTVRQELSDQLKLLETENSRLKEDLAAFENLASGEARNETVGIQRIEVMPDPSTSQGTYRYRFLLAAPASGRDREFRGRLQLVATVLQGGRAVIVNIPGAAAPDAQKYLLKFKYLRRVEGSFTLPPHAVLQKLEIRLLQADTVLTSQQVTM